MGLMIEITCLLVPSEKIEEAAAVNEAAVLGAWV